MSSLATLGTEQRNSNTNDIDIVSTTELCRLINNEDANVPAAVGRCIKEIAQIIDALTVRVRDGGRVIYVGAGTSGRLGVLDASEIPPTFSAPYGQFIGLMAGGERAIQFAVEGAEDSLTQPVTELDAIKPSINPELDSIIGLAASGRTPYVLGALAHSRKRGCFTAGICCVDKSEMRGVAEVVVECPVGPEVVTGSTRMKSGTAQKLILNMISTGVLIRIGKTYGNLMVDVKRSNVKLVDRARRIVRTVLKPLSVNAGDDTDIDELIDRCGGSVKVAIVVARWGCSSQEAHRRLEDVGGILKLALGTA